MSERIRRQTEYYIRDLHARETMRVSWYRHHRGAQDIRRLRAQKAQHQAFLHDLLRRRSLKPIWYARWLNYMGHLLGWLSAFFPRKWVAWIETTLEFWLLMRYEKYLQRLQLDHAVRSMIEAMQMNKIAHNEPDTDVLVLLEDCIRNEQQLIGPEPRR